MRAPRVNDIAADLLGQDPLPLNPAQTLPALPEQEEEDLALTAFAAVSSFCDLYLQRVQVTTHLKMSLQPSRLLLSNLFFLSSILMNFWMMSLLCLGVWKTL
jgi:hypothetical protein